MEKVSFHLTWSSKGCRFHPQVLKTNKDKIINSESGNYEIEEPLIKNSFATMILQQSQLTDEDRIIIANLANATQKKTFSPNKVYGLELYAKLLELEKSGEISGNQICDRLYSAFCEQQGDVVI